ncbi:MAG: TaqI-like C-terminal specificity domain-containing protein [Flavobacterium sp.]
MMFNFSPGVCNEIIYENITGYWIKRSEIKKLRDYFGLPHIVVGLGFRRDGRVAAAYDEKCYPWMGDVYHLIRKTSLFNSDFDMCEGFGA